MDKKSYLASHGIRVRRLNIAMAVITVTISALLLISTYTMNIGFRKMVENTENYIRWQKSAFDLQTASDYLTEQVRCFAVTGNRIYMDNYFTEANVTKRRDNALNVLRKDFSGTETYSQLEDAMKSSVQLMEREYYAMCLTCDAYNLDVTTLPDEIRAIELLPTDKNLTTEQKKSLACSMVFDDIYKQQKDDIYEKTEECLQGLVNTTEIAEETSLNNLNRILIRQQILVLIMITLVVLIVVVTSILLISPLLKAIWHVRTEQPIPVTGSYEFRFLARTYNLMYESNREKREHLVYEAMHDKLTDAYNRSGYEFLLKNIEKDDCTFILIDVDKYKSVNDTYGHDTGDRALIKLANVLRSSFRSQDYICRIGGDEFVVIMVHSGSAAAEMLIKKIDGINENLSHPTDTMPPISISAGIAFGDRKQTVKDADEAMYKVKAAGGKGCRIAE